MPRKKALVLTDHELRLMDVLWDRAQATVAQVAIVLPPPRLAYNTVLSTLRTLEQKGYVAHHEGGKAFVYRALVAGDVAAKCAIDHVLSRFFGNSPNALAVTLLDNVSLKEGDRAKIRALLEKAEEKA